MIEYVKLFLKNYEISTIIGVHEFESNSKQRLLINIEMHISPDLEFEGDDIRKTVDYDFLRKDISELIGVKKFRTQESLCLSILNLILENPNVELAKVSTEKIDVYSDSQSVGCEMCGRYSDKKSKTNNV